MKRVAFTLVELVMVIIILGVLSSIAVHNFSATKQDAIIAKGRSEIASIRSAIVLNKTRQMLQGKADLYPDLLTKSLTEYDKLFYLEGGDHKLLDYPLVHKEDTGGFWAAKLINSGTSFSYVYRLGGGNFAEFFYDNTTGAFDCNHSKRSCRLLTE
jgi:general secretion pathway protein G